MEPNFSGYVTKANLKCADGRTIAPGAFAHQDGMKVPLVYQHNHSDVNQVLGHVILTAKDDGIWGDAYVNKTGAGQNANLMVQNGDLDKFSVWAKDLEEQGYLVHDGVIQEVSLVLAGANPGAQIQNVLMHTGIDAEDLLIVGGELVHDDTKAPAAPPEPAPTPEPQQDPKPDEGDKTVSDVLDTLTEEQQTAVNAVIDDIVKEAVTEALTEDSIQHDNLDSSKKGTKMPRNVFDRTQDGNTAVSTKPELKHDDMKSVLTAAMGSAPEGGTGVPSLRAFVRSDQGKELMHADTYGVENIETLFPDAQALMNTPKFIDRRQEWVKTFLNGTSHSPFARVKTSYADITADEARARGYIKGNQKVEEVFPVFKRSTGPTWIYKKQKLDREDIINIKDFNVVAWLKVEMRGKLDEELARAALFGDGRPTMINGELNPDKIKDPGANSTSGDGIRAIVNDNDLYTGTFDVPMPATPGTDDWNRLLDAVTEAGEFYRGSGDKTAFVSYRVATKLLTIRDNFGKRVYRNLSEVAADMDVSRIERVPSELMPADVLAVVLDLRDYNFGTDAGGEVTLFDDFDIDFNQYKYLMETYLSGALTLPYAAQVFKSVASTSTLATPAQPAFANNVVTIPTDAGVDYYRTDTNTLVADGSTITLDDTVLPIVEIEARPAAGYYFADNLDEHDTWTFEYQA
jgi:HK97 family phage prohead protease